MIGPYGALPVVLVSEGQHMGGQPVLDEPVCRDPVLVGVDVAPEVEKNRR